MKVGHWTSQRNQALKLDCAVNPNRVRLFYLVESYFQSMLPTPNNVWNYHKYLTTNIVKDICRIIATPWGKPNKLIGKLWFENHLSFLEETLVQAWVFVAWHQANARTNVGLSWVRVWEALNIWSLILPRRVEVVHWELLSPTFDKGPFSKFVASSAPSHYLNLAMLRYCQLGP